MNNRDESGAPRVRLPLGLSAGVMLVLCAAGLQIAQHAGWVPSVSAWEWLIGVPQAGNWP